VRELRNVVDRALALCDGGSLRAEHVVIDPVAPTPPERATVPPASPRPGPDAGSLRIDRDKEMRSIEEALSAARGHQGRAAELLGISRRTLFNRLQEYAIKPRWRRSG
jgi:sigma-54-dependent transcriptional regulator